MTEVATVVEQSAYGLGYGEATAYGLIQGLTEFLPVSSSGHLALAHLLGLGALPKELELAFDVLLHAATLLAIIVAFVPDIIRACTAGPRFWGVAAIAVIPTGLAGLFGKHLVEGAGEHFWIIGLLYCYTAALLWYSERRSRQLAVEDVVHAHHHLGEVTPKQAVVVGGLQILALLPGVSRSGSTIAGGLLAGMPPAVAVSFGFLVGLPLMAAAAAKDAIDPEAGFGALNDVVGLGPLAVAFVVALGSGIAAIWLLKLMVRKRRLDWFAGYCVLIALSCFVAEIL